MLFTKTHKVLHNQWMKGTLNLHKAARKLGYKGNAMSKGLRHIRHIMADMGIISVSR